MLKFAAVTMLALTMSTSVWAQTPGLACPDDTAKPTKANRDFVELYNAAQTALKSQRYSDAATFAEAAAPHAADARQLVVLLQLRTAAFYGAGDKAKAAATAEAALGVGCMSDVQRAQFEELRRAQ